MKKIIISIFMVIMNTVFSQNSEVGYPNLAPMSPNAAEFAKYADYPVSHYTGTPNINIPIYDINIDGFKLPINISYHASGIKVTQEATWVGLGWALNAESRISRTAKGVDDFLYGTVDSSRPLISRGYFHAPEQDNVESTHFDPPLGVCYFCRSSLIADPEPDIFYYNLSGMSGKFIIDKSRGAILFDKNHNIKIDILQNPLSSPYTVKFKITDKEGIQYFYDQWEVTKTYKRNGYLNKNLSNATIFDNQMSPFNEVIWNNFVDGTTTTSGNFDYPMVTSWCLTKIITSHGREINFEYDNEQQILPTQESAERYLNLTNGNIINAYAYRSKNITSSLRLKSIKGDFGKISFTASSRVDIKGGAQKLESISIFDKAGKAIKSFKFNYDYFNNDYSGDVLYENVFKRLKLTNITEYDSNDKQISDGYYFQYYSGNFPAKNSKNVDYWGFQNGKSYEDSFFTGLSYTVDKYIPGVKKEMNFDKAIIGTLKNITYPLGGITEFTFAGDKINSDFFSQTYSSNDFIVEDISVYNENSAISHPLFDPFFPIPSNKIYSFTLTKETEIKIRCDLEDQGGIMDPDYTYSNNGSPLGRLRKISGTPQTIFSFGCPETYHISENFPPYDWDGEGAERWLKTNSSHTYFLQPGTYEFEAKTPPKNVITNWRLHIKNEDLYPSGIIEGGGISIKEIKTDSKTRKFNYPIGLMIKEPLLYYIRKNENLGYCIPNELGPICPLFLVQSSEPLAPLTSFNNGNIVGYDWVEEYFEDLDNNISKTKYSYYNNPENSFFSSAFHPDFDYTYPDPPPYINYSNGLINLVEKYKNDDIVEKNDIFYKTTSYNSTTGKKILAFRDQGFNDTGIAGPIHILTKYYYNMEWPLKRKEVNTQYMDNGSQIVSQTQYNYNDRDLLVKQRIISPDNSEIETNFKYAHDIGNPYLILKNMIGVPLESSTIKKNDSLSINFHEISKTIPNFSTSEVEAKERIIGNTENKDFPLQFDVMNKDLATLIMEKQINFDFYDDKGNILQYTAKSGIPTAIVWDYSKTQPIAKIEGAKLSDIPQSLITNILNASDYANPSYSESNLINQLDLFRAGLPTFQVTTYTYKPLVGVSSITPPSGIRELYIYDTANRLIEVRDVNEVLLETNEYHYKP